MLVLHRSNRAELLIDALTELVRTPAGGALAAECIAVQGHGMERWLSMQLARRLGVWANPDFPFPRHLIERILSAHRAARRDAEHDPFAPEIMKWTIHARLPDLIDQPAFAPLHHYLRGDDSGARSLQLAQRIAATFDQYVVFRPEMLAAWEAGDDDGWQAITWRALVGQQPPSHLAARAARFVSRLQASEIDFALLPPRLSLFGVSTLPPLFVSVLNALAAHLELHLFLLSPSDQYWADIRSRREQVRRSARSGGTSTVGDEASVRSDEGNGLLASLGRVGRDFQEIVEDSCEYRDDDRYRSPGEGSMLHALQSDILHLRQRGHNAARLAMRRDDDSIRVHACHSPMREVEVLYDQLLELFAREPGLQPQDVVVMSPAIDTYAPLVDAVFGADSSGSPRLPYRVADRAVRSTDDAINAFLTVITTCAGRLTAAEVLDLLAFEPIRQRFGLEPEDSDLIRKWARDAGIRWGADAAHRQAAGQPPSKQNTWEFGIERLLLGYTMPGDGERMFAGTLPYDDIEGSSTEVLGRFVDFCSKLFEARQLLAAPRSAERWRDDLGRVLETMLANHQRTAYQLQQLRAALADFARDAALGGFGGEIDADSARRELEQRLERRAPGRNFLSGGITFCAMLPMRSIPFEVVALLGMNDDGFPRRQRPLGFDLIASRPRRGDRSVRDDDRYLFLEALLSARRRLIITYVGQSIADNTDLPPSVVVSELLDALSESFTVAPPPGAKREQLQLFAPAEALPSVRDQLLVRHPLQPFSPRYFGSDREQRLFSYSELHCAAARALLDSKQTPPPLITGPLIAPSEVVTELALSELVSFFHDPIRAVLRQRLGLYLGRAEESLDTREPIELDNLEHWQIGDLLIRHSDHSSRLAEVEAPLRAAGLLPPGNLGARSFDHSRRQVELLTGLQRPYRQQAEPQSWEIATDLDGFKLSGRVDRIFPPYRIECRFSQLQGRHLLTAWLKHLVLCASGQPLQTISINRTTKGARVTTLLPVANAAELLPALIALFLRGQSQVLPLFRSASYEYARLARFDVDKARQAALRAFNKDCEYDEYATLVFGEQRDPLGFERDDEPFSFASLAAAVYAPLLAHQEQRDVPLDQYAPEGE